MGEMWSFAAGAALAAAREVFHISCHAEPVESGPAETRGAISTLVTHLRVALVEDQPSTARGK